MNVRAAIVAVCLISAITSAQPYAAPAQTGDAIAVVIDDTPLPLQHQPIRIPGSDAGVESFLVPTREIFEALGASVHAHATEITVASPASARSPRSHTIVLHVAEPVATIDGGDITLANPPELIDGTVYVPLRLVTTALGAEVSYDAQTRTISIARPAAPVIERETPAPGVSPSPVPTALPTQSAPELGERAPIALPTAAIVLRVVREEPARGATVERDRPEISASFGEPVAAASVRILLDGSEITSDATITDRYFIYEPMAPLVPGPHEITVAGRTPLHEAFVDHWSFDSTESTAHNYLAGVEPPSGIPVTSPLIISGITRPRSRVGMVSTSSETAAHFSELAGGSLTDHTIADEHGNFSFRLDLVDTGSGFLDVRLDSTAPGGAVAVKTLRLRL
jgi:hypothetical protein